MAEIQVALNVSSFRDRYDGAEQVLILQPFAVSPHGRVITV